MVNPNAAKTLGLTILPTILLSAARVIELVDDYGREYLAPDAASAVPYANIVSLQFLDT
jgi:hypothetical protein